MVKNFVPHNRMDFIPLSSPLERDKANFKHKIVDNSTQSTKFRRTRKIVPVNPSLEDRAKRASSEIITVNLPNQIAIYFHSAAKALNKQTPEASVLVYGFCSPSIFHRYEPIGF